MTHRFQSPLGKDMEAFLAFKRARGKPYARGEHTLRSFDRAAARQVAQNKTFRVEQALSEWLASAGPRKPVSVTHELSVIRQLCLFIRRRDPTFFVPDREWAPQPRTSSFLPYIFSLDEIRGLLRAVEEQSARWRQWNDPLAVRTLVLVLYCTGVRFGEAIRLRICDVDRCADRLWVTAKGRSRWVPYGRGLTKAINQYAEHRSTISPRCSDSVFFVRPSGRAYSTPAASRIMRQLIRGMGLKRARGRSGPRPYDLRATFAVHRLTRWYRQRVDLQTRLPWLSAYMGHQDLVGTEVYLQATPELLAVASRRFAARFRTRRSRA